MHLCSLEHENVRELYLDRVQATRLIFIVSESFLSNNHYVNGNSTVDFRRSL